MMNTEQAAGCNALCAKCLRSCKQPAAVLLLECPRYLPMPFKVERHRFDQLDLFDEKFR
jgi:hypothetical protein